MDRWSTETTPASRGTDPWISELLPDPATPVTTHSTPSGTSTLTSRRLCVVACRISSLPDGARTDGLSLARSSRWRPVTVPLARRPPTVPSKQTLPPAAPAPGTEVDDVVADRDHLRLVLHHEHRVALVPQPQQQAVHPLDVVRVQPDRRLVEDVGHVGEGGPELADHLDALRLAARQAARRPVEREVAEPDLRERVEGVPQRGEQRRHRRLVEPGDPFSQVADLHRARVGDADPADPRGPGKPGQAGAVALRARGEGDGAVHERPDVRLHRVGVLRQDGPLQPQDQALVVWLMPAIFILTGSWYRKSLSSFLVNLRIGLSGS